MSCICKKCTFGFVVFVKNVRLVFNNVNNYKCIVFCAPCEFKFGGSCLSRYHFHFILESNIFFSTVIFLVHYVEISNSYKTKEGGKCNGV